MCCLTDVIPLFYSILLNNPSILDHSKSWLRRQRKAIRKRLGLEALSEDAAVGIEYSNMLQDQDMLVADVDLVTGAQLSASSASSSSFSNSKNSSSSNNNNSSSSSSETWLVRLIRFMVLGLVDPVSRLRPTSAIQNCINPNPSSHFALVRESSYLPISFPSPSALSDFHNIYSFFLCLFVG